MLTATLHHHLYSYDNPIAHDMLQNLYVDNIISGCSTEEEAIWYYKEVWSIMIQAKFNLRSWAFNSPQLQAIMVVEGTADLDVTVNLLGLLWNTSTDTITSTPKWFLSNTDPQRVTKWLVLQMSSRVYNPWDFCCQLIFKQKMWPACENRACGHKLHSVT